MFASRLVRWVIGFVILILIAGLGLFAASRRVRAYALGARGLQQSSFDPRIWVEDGVSDDWSRSVQRAIEPAVRRIEEVHGRRFADEFRIVLCESQASYNWRTGDPRSGRARGAVFAGHVFLSPRCQRSNTTAAILTHELSHLHFRQILGSAYVTGLPGWFQEGLAVFVSDGGGAEPVSRRDAVAAL